MLLHKQGCSVLSKACLAVGFLSCFLGGANAAPHLQKCWLNGVATEVLCGVLSRPLDPARPDGKKIDVRFAVIPALARNKEPDPVFYFAGGPGQSAVELAGSLVPIFSRVLDRRDLVLMDQRGTGGSAPLRCPNPVKNAALQVDPRSDFQRMRDCRIALQKLPHGDLRFFSTFLAAQDVDAIRLALGAPQVNLVASSYGTRLALEYMRQQGKVVRRVVLDGVSPADMALPRSLPIDSQAALDALVLACEREPGCQRQHPMLQQRLRALLSSLPQTIHLRDPVSGRPASVQLTRDSLMNMVRMAMYSPVTASGLPMAMEALLSERRLEPLAALSTVFGRRTGQVNLYEGMHHSVICSEDMPRLSAEIASTSLPDFDRSIEVRYQSICADWPRAEIPPAFYSMSPAVSPVMILSGGDDPATPPHHGDRVAARLGSQSRHVVVPHAAHGVLSLGCMTDVLFRFLNEKDAGKAMTVDALCMQKIPRPTFFDVGFGPSGGALD